MVEVRFEFNFAQGKLAVLPDSVNSPPDWAMVACRQAWKTGMSSPFSNLTAEDIKKVPRGCLRELIGIYEGMRAYVVNPPHDPAMPLEANEAIAKLHSSASQLVAKKLITQLRKLDAKMEALLPAATSQQLIGHGDRYQRGIKSAVGSGAGIFEPQSMTTQIYYLVWCFWPKLVEKKKLSAADLHKWLDDELCLFASIKLVERIHTDLKLASRFQSHSRAT